MKWCHCVSTPHQTSFPWCHRFASLDSAGHSSLFVLLLLFCVGGDRASHLRRPWLSAFSERYCVCSTFLACYHSLLSSICVCSASSSRDCSPKKESTFNVTATAKAATTMRLLLPPKARRRRRKATRRRTTTRSPLTWTAA